MWIGQVSSTALFEAGRWTVSYFAHAGSGHLSAFPMVALSALVAERKGTADPQQMNGQPIAYLGLENVKSHTGELVDFALRPAHSVKSRSKLFEPEDILYGRLRPELNKVYLVEESVGPGLCSGEFIVLIPDRERVVPAYLRHMLASPFVANYAAKLRAGASLPRLNSQDLLALQIPLPPMEIQLRLADTLAHIDAEIRSLRTRLQELPLAQGRALMQAIATGSGDLQLDLEQVSAVRNNP